MLKWLIMICTILSAGTKLPNYVWVPIKNKEALKAALLKMKQSLLSDSSDQNLTKNFDELKNILTSNEDIQNALNEFSKKPENDAMFLFKLRNNRDTVYIGKIKNRKFAWVNVPYYPLETGTTNTNKSLEYGAIKYGIGEDKSPIFVTYIPKGEGYVQQVTSVKQFLANPPKSLASDKYYGFVFTKSDSAPILAELSNNGSIRFFGRNFDEYIARTKELITVAEGNYQEFKKALDNNIVWVRAHA
jgi:hypothetical protein